MNQRAPMCLRNRSFRHDAPSIENRGQGAACEKGRRGRNPPSAIGRHLGQPFRQRSIPIFTMPRSNGKPATASSSPMKRGSEAISSRPANSVAQPSSRRVVHPAPPARPTPSWTVSVPSSSGHLAGDWAQAPVSAERQFMALRKSDLLVPRPQQRSKA